MPIYSNALRLILMLFLYLCLSPPTGLFPSAFTAKILYVYLPPLGPCIFPSVLFTKTSYYSRTRVQIAFLSVYHSYKSIFFAVFFSLLCFNIQETTQSVLSSEAGRYVV